MSKTSYLILALLFGCTQTVYIEKPPSKIVKFEAIYMWYPGSYCIHFRDGDELGWKQYYYNDQQTLKDDVKQGESMYVEETTRDGKAFFIFHIHNIKELGTSGYDNDFRSAIMKVQ